jgi:hypothetical protein
VHQLLLLLLLLVAVAVAWYVTSEAAANVLVAELCPCCCCYWCTVEPSCLLHSLRCTKPLLLLLLGSDLLPLDVHRQRI